MKQVTMLAGYIGMNDCVPFIQSCYMLDILIFFNPHIDHLPFEGMKQSRLKVKKCFWGS